MAINLDLRSADEMGPIKPGYIKHVLPWKRENPWTHDSVVRISTWENWKRDIPVFWRSERDRNGYWILTVYAVHLEAAL